jgi:hypothetical protein
MVACKPRIGDLGVPVAVGFSKTAEEAVVAMGVGFPAWSDTRLSSSLEKVDDKGAKVMLSV